MITINLARKFGCKYMYFRFIIIYVKVLTVVLKRALLGLSKRK